MLLASVAGLRQAFCDTKPQRSFATVNPTIASDSNPTESTAPVSILWRSQGRSVVIHSAEVLYADHSSLDDSPAHLVFGLFVISLLLQPRLPHVQSRAELLRCSSSDCLSRKAKIETVADINPTPWISVLACNSVSLGPRCSGVASSLVTAYSHRFLPSFTITSYLFGYRYPLEC